MTLRELFDTIINYEFSTEVQIDPMDLASGVVIGLIVIVALLFWAKADGKRF